MKNTARKLKYVALELTSAIALFTIWSLIEDGWAKDFGEPNNQLYVHLGIGMSIAPIRLFCPPELTFFTLELG